MRPLWLLFALLTAAPALAQTSPPPVADSGRIVAQVPAAVDTVAALHRLFSAKRQQSAAVIATTVGTGLAGLGVAENTRRGNDFAVPLIATGISLLSIPVTAAEILYYRRFTRRKEQQAVADFQAHQLRRHLKRQLQPQYFRL